MKAIVFGTRNYYRIKKNQIRQKYEIIGFIDSTIKPGETTLTDGVLTINPIDLKTFPEVPVLLMSVKFCEMWDILMQMGIDERRIVFGLQLDPAYDPLECVLKEEKYVITSVDRYLNINNGKYNYRAKNTKEFEACVREIYMKKFPIIEIIKNFPVNPLSSRFGIEHGTPIDRVYIERFLQNNSDKIHGDVAEFAVDTYTKRYGSDITSSYIFHVNGWGDNALSVDLSTGEGVCDNMLDCLICTQTIQFIYDLSSVMHNISRLLKPNGCALITVHGISQISLYDYRNWGEYWRFTPLSLGKLFDTEMLDVYVESYGNVKTSVAMLYGLCAEDIEQNDFDYNDEQYPLIISCVIRKKSSITSFK